MDHKFTEGQKVLVLKLTSDDVEDLGCPEGSVGKIGTIISHNQRGVSLPYFVEFEERVNGDRQWWFPEHALEAVNEINKKTSSDGGSTIYYQLPPGATELNDLIYYKQMNWPRANIFKASYRLGEKDVATEEYDLNKIIFFANLRLQQIAKEKSLV